MSAEVSRDPAVLEAKGCLFVVADGLGGLARGEVASSEAAGALMDLYRGLRCLERPEWLVDAVHTVNERIYRMNEGKGFTDVMATTLTASLFHGSRFYIAHVGDSRVYRIRGDEMQCLTRDHSVSRHSLTRAIGTEPHVEVDLYEEGVEEGDHYVQCTDGFYSMLRESEIVDSVRNQRPEESVRELVRLANRYGGDDNITVQVIRIG